MDDPTSTGQSRGGRARRPARAPPPARGLPGGRAGDEARAMTTRHDWTTAEIAELLDRPFHDLLHEAHEVHRRHFDPHVVEGAMLLSIKTGACPEDCAYCPQSAKWSTDLSPQRLMPTEEILAGAREAAEAGAACRIIRF